MTAKNNDVGKYLASLHYYYEAKIMKAERPITLSTAASGLLLLQLEEGKKPP